MITNSFLLKGISTSRIFLIACNVIISSYNLFILTVVIRFIMYYIITFPGISNLYISKILFSTSPFCGVQILINRSIVFPSDNIISITVLFYDWQSSISKFNIFTCNFIIANTTIAPIKGSCSSAPIGDRAVRISRATENSRIFSFRL